MRQRISIVVHHHFGLSRRSRSEVQQEIIFIVVQPLLALKCGRHHESLPKVLPAVGHLWTDGNAMFER